MRFEIEVVCTSGFEAVFEEATRPAGDLLDSAKVMRTCLEGITEAAFLQNIETQNAVPRRFEIIG